MAKKGKDVSVERQESGDLSPFSVTLPESGRPVARSGLNGASASAIGMGLVLQGGLTEPSVALAGDAEPDDATNEETTEAPVSAEKDAGTTNTEAPLPNAPVGNALEDGDAPVEADFTASAPVVAAGRTTEVGNAGSAAAAMAAALSEEEDQDDTILETADVTGEAARAVDLIDPDEETDGLLGSVLDPVLGNDGIVDGLLDSLAGEGGVLDQLLGEGSVLDDVLGTVVGENGLLDLDVLEGLLGEDGFLGGAIQIVIGDEGLVADLLGEDGVVDDLLDPLIADDGVLDGLLSPVLGGGVVDDLIGEDSIVSDLVGDLFGESGLVDEVVADIPVVGDLLGSDGLLGGVFGEGSALGGLLGSGGEEEETADGSDTAAGEEESGDGGFLDGLLGGDSLLGGADESVTEPVEEILGGEDGVLSGLLGDDDPFNMNVPEGEADEVDDLYAGLVGENSLTGSLAGQGILGAAADAVADSEVDDLLNEILGPSSADVAVGENVFGALFEGVEGLGTQVGGVLADVAGGAEESLPLDTDASLLDGLLPDNDDSV